VGHSRSIVFKLSSLFVLDSFAGGFVVQSFAAYWFYLRFGVQLVKLGVIFFWLTCSREFLRCSPRGSPPALDW
jgi:hypothetical protein